MSRLDESLRHEHADALLLVADEVGARFSTAHGVRIVTVEFSDAGDPSFVIRYDGRDGSTRYPFDPAYVRRAARQVAREIQNRRFGEPAPELLGFVLYSTRQADSTEVE